MVQLKIFGKRVDDDKPTLEEQVNTWCNANNILKYEIVDIVVKHSGEGMFMATNIFFFYEDGERNDMADEKAEEAAY